MMGMLDDTLCHSVTWYRVPDRHTPRWDPLHGESTELGTSPTKGVDDDNVGTHYIMVDNDLEVLGPLPHCVPRPGHASSNGRLAREGIQTGVGTPLAPVSFFDAFYDR